MKLPPELEARREELKRQLHAEMAKQFTTEELRRMSEWADKITDEDIERIASNGIRPEPYTCRFSEDGRSLIMTGPDPLPQEPVITLTVAFKRARKKSRAERKREKARRR